MTTENVECPISEEPAQMNQHDGYSEFFCPTCGQFRVSGTTMRYFELHEYSRAERETLLRKAKEQAPSRASKIPMLLSDMMPKR